MILVKLVSPLHALHSAPTQFTATLLRTEYSILFYLYIIVYNILRSLPVLKNFSEFPYFMPAFCLPAHSSVIPEMAAINVCICHAARSMQHAARETLIPLYCDTAYRLSFRLESSVSSRAESVCCNLNLNVVIWLLYVPLRSRLHGPISCISGCVDVQYTPYNRRN